MSYHNIPSSARQSTTNAQGQTAPTGYHYMPDGSLMSDAEHLALYGSGEILRTFTLNTANIKAAGETRSFTIAGSGVFSLEIKNESNRYYNFVTNEFQAVKARLDNIRISGNYSGNIKFPAAPTTTDTVNGAVTSGVKVVMDTVVANTMEVGDKVTGNAYLNANNVTVVALDPDGDNTSEFSLSEAVAISDGVTLSFTGSDQYDFYLLAEQGTRHSSYNEVRFEDNSIDINSSTGSNSLLVQKVIYQTLDVSLTLSALSPNSVAVFSGQTPTTKTITTQIGVDVGKIPFSIPISAGSTHSFRINRTPTINDVVTYVQRTIGSAVAIEGEDVSGSTYYRWTIDNIDGISAGMIPKAGNITSGSVISSYEDVLTEMEGTDYEKKIVQTRIEATDKLGTKPTITRNASTRLLTTTQTGTIIFNKQQAAALADDVIKIYGYGPSTIRALSDWDIELSDIEVTLTKPTAVTTAAVINSTSVPIDDADGIMDDVSTVSSINIDSSVADPTVTNIGSYSGSTATLTLSAAQTLESGETLTFDGAGRTITITGNIEIKKVGEVASNWDSTLYFDLERFLTATDES